MAYMNTLIDKFDNDSFDTDLWSRTNATQVVEEDGVLKIASIIAGNYVACTSDASYNLTGSYVYIKVIDAGDQDLESWETYPITVILNASNNVQWSLIGGVLQVYKLVSDVSNSVGSPLAYDADVHKYLRIREASGTLYFDYSTDGITWTNHTTLANPFAVTALTAEISVGTWQEEASTTEAQFGDLNICLPFSVRSSSKNDSSTGTALSVSAPAGAATGDKIIILAQVNGQTTIVDNNGSTPFTEDLNDYQPNPDNGHTVSIFSRTLQAGDPATYQFTSGASGRWGIIAICIKGTIQYDVAPSEDNADNADGSDSGTINCPSVSVSGETLHIVLCGWDTAATGTITTPAYYTLLQNANSGGEPTHASYKVFHSSASTGLVSCVNSEYGARIVLSFSIEVGGGHTDYYSPFPTFRPGL